MKQTPSPNVGYQFGLIGFPLEHSISPVLHHTALNSLNLKGIYQLFPVNQAEFHEFIPKLLLRIRSGQLDGLNVTIPYKQTIIQYLDELTPAANAIGAVNTIYENNGKIFGHNTDAIGFMQDLERLNIIIQSKMCIVLGAGGAARAVIYSLLNSDCLVMICARKKEQADQIKRDFKLAVNPDRIKIIPFTKDTLFANLPDVFLIVNTTPVGMSPEIDSIPWPENLKFPSHACLYDLIYNPLETKLIRFALQSGAYAVNGLGMLVEQAAMAFSIWTGLDPDRDAMHMAAIQALT